MDGYSFPDSQVKEFSIADSIRDPKRWCYPLDSLKSSLVVDDLDLGVEVSQTLIFRHCPVLEGDISSSQVNELNDYTVRYPPW